MTSRISTPIALDDQRRWRKVIALHHPDRGGDHEGFVWIQAVRGFVREAISAKRRDIAFEAPYRPGASETGPDRVPFPPGADFATLTRRALLIAEEAPLPYQAVLWLLRDCEPLAGFVAKERRGASYRQLAAIGHRAVMNKAQRARWYQIARGIPLADRHASHVLGRLEGSAA